MGLNEVDQLVHDRQAGNGFGPAQTRDHREPVALIRAYSNLEVQREAARIHAVAFGRHW
jgi:hypothetical protein